MLLTVAIPTWNRGEYLAAALDSLAGDIERARLGADVEVLVSDNGSEDDTPRVAGERAARHPFIRHVRNERNFGVRFNILRVMREARGDYFMFLGDDDRLAPGSLAEIAAALRANEGVPALFLQQSGENALFTDIEQDTFLDFRQVAARYFYDIGNAGSFAVRAAPARAAIEERGTEFFNEYWPQTQAICLGLAGERRPCLFSTIKGVGSELHSALTVHSSLYFWRPGFADLMAAARDVAPAMGEGFWSDVTARLTARLRATVTVIQFYGAFVDDAEQRRRTAESIRHVMPQLPPEACKLARSLRLQFALPRPAAAALYRARVRLRQGRAGVEFLNGQVRRERRKRELAGRGLSVRELL